MPVRPTILTMKALWADRRVRYLAVGGGNTVSGYLVSAGCWWLISRASPFAAASTFALISTVTIATILNVTISYITQKLLVFRTRGHVLAEYSKCYAVNSVSIGISYVLFPALVKFARMNPYLAMALITAVSVVVSYLGHSRFTFMPTRSPKR